MNRLLKEKIIFSGSLLATLLGCSLFLWVLGCVWMKGAPALSIEFLFSESKNFGSAGGVLYQITGTLLLMTCAVLLCVPIAVGATLFQTEFVLSEHVYRRLNLFSYSLNSVPTILFGLVGYLVFGMILNTGVSWLTGVLTLAVMILPTVQVSFREAVEAIPPAYREHALAMGLTPWQMVRAVVFPRSLFGLGTGVLLGLARAAGETAAIMFTASTFSGVRLPRSFSDPVPTLQTHILTLAQEALDPKAVQAAWGAGWVLLFLVFCLTGVALFFRSRVVMEAER